MTDRSADAEAEVVAFEIRLRTIRRLEDVSGAEILIAQELEPGARHLVRAPFGDDADGRAGIATEFGGGVVRDQLEFLHRFDVRQDQYRAAPRAAADRYTIDHGVVAARTVSVGV